MYNPTVYTLRDPEHTGLLKAAVIDGIQHHAWMGLVPEHTEKMVPSRTSKEHFALSMAQHLIGHRAKQAHRPLAKTKLHRKVGKTARAADLEPLRGHDTGWVSSEAPALGQAVQCMKAKVLGRRHFLLRAAKAHHRPTAEGKHSSIVTPSSWISNLTHCIIVPSRCQVGCRKLASDARPSSSIVKYFTL